MLLFERQYQVSISHEEESTFLVSCSLKDQLHDLILTHTVSIENPTIISGELQVIVAPNPECQQLVFLPKKLVGVRLDKGFTKTVLDRLGGPLGCVNLVNMVLISLPLVINSSWYYHSYAGEYSPQEIEEMEKEQMKGVCLAYPSQLLADK